jgi:hypothetical protein
VLTVAVFAIAISSSASMAQVRVVQTGCDTLSINPPRVHVNFAVINLTGTPLCSIHLIPVPSGPYPPCEIFDCSHPPGWECQVDPTGGAQWRTIPGVPCVQPYQKQDNFDIIIDPPYCCYRAEFDDGNGNIFFTDLVCFQCESPTSTHPGTWGAVKAMYR